MLYINDPDNSYISVIFKKDQDTIICDPPKGKVGEKEKLQKKIREVYNKEDKGKKE